VRSQPCSSGASSAEIVIVRHLSAGPHSARGMRIGCPTVMRRGDADAERSRRRRGEFTR